MKCLKKFSKGGLNLNFKEIYKNANNNISGDKSKIDAIFEKAEKRKNFISAYSKQLSICAAAIILIFSVGFLSQYRQNTDTNVNNNMVKTDNSTFGDELEIAKGNKTKEDDTPAKDTEAAKSSDKTENDVTQEKGDKDYTQTGDDTKGNEENAALPSMDSNDDTPSSNDFTDSSVAAASEPPVSEAPQHDEKVKVAEKSTPPKNTTVSSSGRGGGGGGGSSAGGAYANVFEITTEEYYNYLNINILDLFSKLPSGMSYAEVNQIYVTKDQRGRYLADSAVFIILDNADPSKIISITTSKLKCDAETIFNNTSDKVKINNVSAVVLSNSTPMNAYFKYKDVWFGVSASGISKEAFEMFIANGLK